MKVRGSWGVTDDVNVGAIKDRMQLFYFHFMMFDVKSAADAAVS